MHTRGLASVSVSVNPRPATIDLGTDEIGRWAVNRLVNRIARPGDAPIRMLIVPKLVTAQAT